MSPSLQTMGFFMSDINFCNTKEQLNHLGEVVTGKVDGSPTGADIDESTLPYTGQVRKTLPALEEEYQTDIDNFVQVSDQLIVDKTAEFDTSIANKEVEADAAIDSYRLLNKGPYTSGVTLESKFEYITYNGEAYFATNPPYTTTATTPDADGNLFISGYTTFENVANKIGNQNELSNSNFLTPSPDAITHPNATPESYVAGTQIFSGVYAGDSGCTITLIDGRVNCTAGDYQFKLPNTGGLERVPAFTSSVSDYDGIPKTSGVSHALVGNEYVVTVTPTAGDVFSVKFEQGSVATWHKVQSGVLSTGSTTPRLLSERFAEFVNVKDEGASGDWVQNVGGTDDTVAIKRAIQKGIDTGKNVVFPSGYYLYDNSDGSFFIDTRETNNFKIVGEGFVRIIVVGSLNNDYVFNVASKSSRLNFYLENIDIHYFGSNNDVGGIVVTRNGLQNQSEWGGTCSMYRVWLAGFTRNQLYIKRNYLSTFKKCVFTGVDNVYDTGSFLPAIPGARSVCVYISGGDPGDTEKDFTNCCVFDQCEFQAAKYGIQGFHIRQTDFRNCVFQYCWIGFSNVVDEVHGGYNSGDVSFSGINYFEYMANRCISDVAIDDDGVTVIDTGYRSKFYSQNLTEFNGEQVVQVRTITGGLSIAPPQILTDYGDAMLEVVHPTLGPVLTIDGFANTKLGRPLDFGNTTVFSDTSNYKILDTSAMGYLSSTKAISGTAGDAVFTSGKVRATTVNRFNSLLATCEGGIQDGTGNVQVEIPDVAQYPVEFIRASFVEFSGGGTPYTGDIYPTLSSLGGVDYVRFYKDLQRTQLLTWNDMSVIGASKVSISIEYYGSGS